MINDEARIRKAVDAVHRDFLNAMNDLAGTHAASIAGIIRFKKYVEDEVLPGKGPDATLSFGHGSPNESDSFFWQSWRIVDLPERLDGDGHVPGDLGRAWLVLVASLWNEEFRDRFAAANEIERFDDPGMADLNRLRNDVLHHGAIATKRNAGRCEVFDWFSPGDEVHPRLIHVARFMGYLHQARPTTELNPSRDWRQRDAF